MNDSEKAASTIDIRFDFVTSQIAPQPLLPCNPEDMVSLLLSEGYRFLEIHGLPGKYSDAIEAMDNSVTLWVENDAKDLWYGYVEIERLLSLRMSVVTHFVFLNNGWLQIKTELVGCQAMIEITRCPGLRLENQSIFCTSVAVDVYLSAWRRIGLQLANVVEQAMG